VTSIQVDIDDSAFRRAIARLQEQAINLQPVMEDVGAYLERSTDQRFRAETAPDGSRWHPLAPATRVTKKNSKILNETGQMRASLSYAATATSVTVGFSDIKAVWHQFGTRPYVIKPKSRKKLKFAGSDGKPVFARTVNHPGLPARPMLGVNEDDEAEILEIIAEAFEAAWNG
jgi:phage virion morphogenesis protein